MASPSAKTLDRISAPDPEFASPKHEAAHALLKHRAFDYTMGAIIMLNFVVVIVETDQSVEDGTPEGWVGTSSFLVLLIFAAELCFRLYVHRCQFWYDPWNMFDFIVVSIDLLFSLIGLVAGNLFSVSLLRVLRLCKLARVSKVFRVFPELRLMMAGLVGSMRSIFWGTLLLTFALLVWSVIAVQFIHPLNKALGDQGVYDGCDRCAKAYDSVMRACLTFTQQIVAGDSWGQATMPVIEHHPWTAVYFMAVFLSVGLAVMNLILGVVVNVAEKARDDLKQEMEDEILLTRMESQSHLMQVCAAMDADKSGELTKVELIEGYKTNADFRKTLEDMEICEEELEIVWTILDSDHSGKVSYTEFVTQVYKMKGSDNQYMLAYIKFYINVIKDKICEQMAAMQDQIVTETKNLEQEVEHVEQAEKAMTSQIEKAIDRNNGVMDDLIRQTTPMDSPGSCAEKNHKTQIGLSSSCLQEAKESMCAGLLEETRQGQTQLLSAVSEMMKKLEVHLNQTSSSLQAEIDSTQTARTDRAPSWCPPPSCAWSLNEKMRMVYVVDDPPAQPVGATAPRIGNHFVWQQPPPRAGKPIGLSPSAETGRLARVSQADSLEGNKACDVRLSIN